MFNYQSTQTEVTAVLAELGQRVTLEKANGNNAKSYGAWGSTAQRDSAPSVSQVVGEQRVLYLSGGIKKVPEVGDSIVVSKQTWSIDQVEAYMPATTVIAYKVTVSQ